MVVAELASGCRSRTARVLHENEGAAGTLAEAGSQARAEGGVAAFEWLPEHRLHQLALAFATKYLFFAPPAVRAVPRPSSTGASADGPPTAPVWCSARTGGPRTTAPT